MPDVLSANQRRTKPAREALAAKFATPEEKREYYREIGERGRAGRVVLSAEQAAALAEAYALLSKIADRLPTPSEIA